MWNFLDQGSNPYALLWKCRVLTPGPPRKPSLGSKHTNLLTSLEASLKVFYTSCPSFVIRMKISAKQFIKLELLCQLAALGLDLWPSGAVDDTWKSLHGKSFLLILYKNVCYLGYLVLSITFNIVLFQRKSPWLKDLSVHKKKMLCTFRWIQAAAVTAILIDFADKV